MGDAGLDYYFLVALPFAFVVAAADGDDPRAHADSPPLRPAVGYAAGNLGRQPASCSRRRAASSARRTSRSQAPHGFAAVSRLPGEFSMPYTRLFILALVAVCLARRLALPDRNPAGRRTRAVMQNREMAGVARRRHAAHRHCSPSALASGLAGVAGCALALIGPIGPVARHLLHRRRVPGRHPRRRRAVIGSAVAALLHRLAERNPRIPDDGITGEGDRLRPGDRVPAVAAGRHGPAGRRGRGRAMAQAKTRHDAATPGPRFLGTPGWCCSSSRRVLLFVVAPAMLSDFRLNLLGEVPLLMPSSPSAST